MKLKKVRLKDATIVTKTYEIPENVLALILGVEALIDTDKCLPETYMKEANIFLDKLKIMAGIKKTDYGLYAMTKMKHYYEVEYTEEFRNVDDNK